MSEERYKLSEEKLKALTFGKDSDWPNLSIVVATLDKSLKGKSKEEILVKSTAVERAVHGAIVEDKLRCQVPNLFDLQLEGELQDRIDEGISDAIHQARKYNSALEPVDDGELGGYAIAINQTHVGDTSNIENALKYLNGFGGIDITGYNMRHRFLVFGKEGSQHPGADAIIRDSIVGGYYRDPYLGRFVAAVPLLGEEAASPMIDHVLDIAGVTREGEVSRYPDKRRVLGSKFVAYYIDSDGTVWQNDSFMRSDAPIFSQIHTE